MPKVVLLVDDDPSVIDLLVNILTLLGLETKVASNGRDGLNAIKASPPDAVILDLMMPVMDGFTMLSQLRKEEVGQKMPVIVLSALADQKGMMDRLPGIIGTITKGRFSLLDLRQMLEKAGISMDGSSTSAPKPEPAPAAAPTTPVPAPAVKAPISAAPEAPKPPPVPPAPAPTSEPAKPATITPLPEDTVVTPPLGTPRPANGHKGEGSPPTS